MREQTMTQQRDVLDWAVEMAESMDALLRSIDTWPSSLIRIFREIVESRPRDTRLACPKEEILLRAWELAFRRRELGMPASPGVATLTRAILAEDEALLLGSRS